MVWKVEKGVLRGSEPRGTWLVSEKEYGDFILEFEWKIGQRGNSGAALRAPMSGAPRVSKAWNCRCWIPVTCPPKVC